MRLASAALADMRRLEAHGVSDARQAGGSDLAVGREPFGFRALDIAAIGVVDAERDRSAHHERQVAPLLDIAHAAAQREVRHSARAFERDLGIGGFPLSLEQRDVDALRRKRRQLRVGVFEFGRIQRLIGGVRPIGGERAPGVLRQRYAPDRARSGPGSPGCPRARRRTEDRGRLRPAAALRPGNLPEPRAAPRRCAQRLPPPRPRSTPSRRSETGRARGRCGEAGRFPDRRGRRSSAPRACPRAPACAGNRASLRSARRAR